MFKYLLNHVQWICPRCIPLNNVHSLTVQMHLINFKTIKRLIEAYLYYVSSSTDSHGILIDKD